MKIRDLFGLFAGEGGASVGGRSTPSDDLVRLAVDGVLDARSIAEAFGVDDGWVMRYPARRQRGQPRLAPMSEREGARAGDRAGPTFRLAEVQAFVTAMTEWASAWEAVPLQLARACDSTWMTAGELRMRLGLGMTVSRVRQIAKPSAFGLRSSGNGYWPLYGADALEGWGCGR